ncbi:hypothetical protein GCM10009827_114110 [Dactylosporangium maewongense]|uniref:DUF2997 domain-containing protein n=1 Tax=Dactylosporangium maewongense TaxID=634393 RepID=A0ABN2DA32_9ACTN
MTSTPRIVVTVGSDGQISAETEGLLGGECLDYIAVLEDLLAARTVQSAYTADYARVRVDEPVLEVQRDVDRA